MIFFSILSVLFWPITIIGLIVFFARRRKKGVHPTNNKEWYLQLALSKEDAVSQLFLLLAVFFLGVTLLTFNRDLGDPFSWQTIVFLASALALVSAYVLKTFYSLVCGLIGIALWWGAQAAEWVGEKGGESFMVFFGTMLLALLFYTLGRFHEREMKWKRFSLVYFMLGLIPITGALFFLSSKYGLAALGAMTKGGSLFGSWQVTLSILFFLAVLVGSVLYTVTRRLMSPFEAVAVLFLAFLFGIIALLPEQQMFVRAGGLSSFYQGGGALSGVGVMWAIIFNLAVFFELLGLILLGYLRRETWLINLGALFLFFFIAAKYFDWFFTFLNKSIFFIIAGILLFAIGWFMERGRRYMISSIKTETPLIP